MGHDDITCENFIRTLERFVSGDLGRADELCRERHLEGCPNCRSYVEDYRATIRASRDAHLDGAGDDAALPRPLAESILASRRRRH